MKNIDQNFRFMLLEVTKQLENTVLTLEDPTSESIEKIEARDDYIDNLKSVIENACFSRLHGSGFLDKRSVDKLRAVHIASNNLERLADHAVNIVRQTRHLTDKNFIKRYEYQLFFHEIFQALDRMDKALLGQDMSEAFKICLAEYNLDTLYKSQFDRILNELRSGSETGNLLTTLFIFRYLERIGDALLNIGEAAIFCITGEKFKLHQYNALRDTLAKTGADVPLADVEFESIWGTRSGCRIGKVQPTNAKGGRTQSVIFKEGNRRKLLQEKENIEHWERIMPGLPPKVVALREDETSVSLLIEYLGGCTLQDIVLSAERRVLDNAMFLLEHNVQEAWEQTLTHTPSQPKYVAQIRSRLPDVFRLYPRLRFEERCVGGMRARSLDALLLEAEAVNDELPAPFTVFIHGDFNLNNIVYNHEDQRIHFIDLHRSRDSDYLQDVSVFMVSNFRLPVFEPELRTPIDYMIREFYRFARHFATQHGDAHFDARLTLGVARSFLTSTRFELNPKFARSMFWRGVFLLERLIAFRGRRWEEFTLPLDVFTYF